MKNQTFSRFICYNSVFSSALNNFIFAFFACIFFIYTRFSNTHEPLIDEETFALARKRIATRHRPTKSDEIDLFSGLLFCGDCGYKMYLQKGAGTPERKHAYTCGNYRNRARNDFLCTTHYIRKTVLKELVLADLQRVLVYVKEHEQEFVRTAAECGEQAAKRPLPSRKRSWTKRTNGCWNSTYCSANFMRTWPWPLVE